MLQRSQTGSSLGAFRFRFAVIANSHCEPDGVAGGRNPRSNGRTRWIVDRVNRLDPEFVVHLGDVVHPIPAMPTFDAAAQAARGILDGLSRPTYVTPGNHDIGDKPAFWMPAATASPDWVSLYEGYFGPAFRSFGHGGLHCVLLNSPILNTGHALERRQRDWLEGELRQNREKRIVLFTHYPPYLRDPGEDSHYDNIDEPARSWLLSLIESYRVEAVFCGHVHQFFYNRLGGTDLYLAPSTSFARRDYSEMFRVAPADEFGKNDEGKVGFFVVDCHEHGHTVRFERSNGRRADEDTKAASDLIPPHPRERAVFALGAHLRHPWAETVELPFSGPVDEFNRRVVRNDYPVAAFWDMGVRDLRVPLRDLRNETTRARMRDMVANGHRFVVFTAGAANAMSADLVAAHRDLVAAWEIIIPAADLAASTPVLKEFRAATGVPVFVARMESTADEMGDPAAHGVSFKHHVTHGFSVGALDYALRFRGAPVARRL